MGERWRKKFTKTQTHTKSSYRDGELRFSGQNWRDCVKDEYMHERKQQGTGKKEMEWSRKE